MHILVTGGAGFIGSHCVDRFLEEGHQVTIIDRPSTGRHKYENPKARLVYADIRDRSAIATAFADTHPDVVIHCAANINARLSLEDPVADADTNITGALNCFHEARKNGMKKFIFISTGGAMYSNDAPRPTPETVREQPLAPYAIGKLAVERYLQFFQNAHGIRTLSLRVGNVYGPRQNPTGTVGVVPILLKQLLQGKEPVIYGSGEQTRDLIYIDDVVSAIVAAVNRFEVTGVFNIGTGEEITMNEIAEMLLRFFPNVSKVIHDKSKPEGQLYSSLDSTMAREQFEWEPTTSLAHGIEKTVEWAKGTKDLLEA